MSLYHDVIEALTPLGEAFERLGIEFYSGGSVSSSLHGMALRTQDVDLVADLKPNQVHPLAWALQSEYYLDEQAWQDAVSGCVFRCKNKRCLWTWHRDDVGASNIRYKHRGEFGVPHVVGVIAPPRV